MVSTDHKATHHGVWTTAWGPMGAVCSAEGITRVILPHYGADELAALLAWEHAGTTRDEEPFALLIELSRAYFNGRATDFGPVECVLPGEGSFSGKVLRQCRRIGYGQSMSYSDLAKRIGQEDAARAVATALSKNTIPLVVPCHRVTYANGEPGGFSAEGGPAFKQRMLALEAGAKPTGQAR